MKSIEKIDPLLLFRHRCVVFDFDGTLCDSAGDILATLYEVVRLHGIDPDGLNPARIGPPLPLMIRQVVGEQIDQAVIDSMVVEYRQIYEKSDFPASPLYPGATDLLRQLKSAGIRLAVATNKKERSTHHILEKKGLLSFFDEVLSSDRNEEKWDKERMLRYILDVTHTKPDECGFIGDTGGDVLAGKKVAVTTIGALYGYGTAKEVLESGPDYCCERLTDLLPAKR